MKSNLHGHWEEVKIVALLKACAKEKNIHKGSRIHDAVLRRGLLGSNVFVWNALINMHAKCGSLTDAKRVHEAIAVRDVVSWTTLLTGYVRHGKAEEAVWGFGRMQSEGICPNPLTLSCILKACGCIKAIAKGKEMHARIAMDGLSRRDVVLCNAMVDMYAKCGILRMAEEVFDAHLIRNVVSWNALIAGYAQQGQSKRAVNSFARMQCEGLCPDVMTLSSILNACGSFGGMRKGKEIHGQILLGLWTETNCALHNALVDMYVKCGAVAKAQQVFEELPFRDVVSWTTLIAGNVQHGHDRTALDYFECMRCEGLRPNAITFTYILKACGNARVLHKGEKVHAEVLREGFLEENSELSIALVDMYAKCGALAKAQQVCDNLPTHDVVSLTSLIAGYLEHGHGEGALNCFDRMCCEGIVPDVVTYLCMLKVCGGIGAVEKGKEIHHEMVKEGLLMKDPVVGPALVDMYSKCGNLTKAQEVFDGLSIQDVVSWTALISGYGQQGKHGTVFSLFHKMRQEGVVPDLVTFTVLLNACSFWFVG